MIKGIPHQQSCSTRSRLFHGQVGAFLQENFLLDKKGVLKRGELVLAKRRTAVNMVARFEFRAVGANFENDTGTVAADNRRPLVDKEVSVLLQGFTGPVLMRESCCHILGVLLTRG